MTTFYAILADVVAIIHGLFSASMLWVVWPIINGSPLRQHKQRLAIGFAYFFLVPIQWCVFDECLVTQLEKHLIHLSGQSSYEGGFLYHYFGMSSALVTALSMLISMTIAIRILYNVITKKEVISETRD